MHTTLNHDLEGIAADRFRSVAKQFQSLQEGQAEARRFDEVCHLELAWAAQTAGLNGCREKYEASVRILRDLAKLRWRILEDRLGIELAAPPESLSETQSVSEYKNSVRDELRPIVSQQLGEKTVRAFIQRLEKPTASSKRRKISDLIADGRELRTRLLAASEAAGGERTKLCREAVQPYLQLIESDKLDEHTGIPLGDIWRYFRMTWSIPSTNIPGRNLFYLIRDAAHPYHAVMGITALSNVALTQKERDNALGWTAEATIEKMKKAVCSPGTAHKVLQQILAELEENITSGLAVVDHGSLLRADEVNEPTEGTIQRLRRRANEFAVLRQDILKEAGMEQAAVVQEMEEVSYGVPNVSDEVLKLEAKIFGDAKMNAARRAMVAKKRAGELARLLQARLILRTYHSALLDPRSCVEAASKDDVTSAINAAWGAAKSARAGTNMLEITTCGAIRPYNHILGGKLTALLMLSPQVAADYKKRYGSTPSIISSMMKNKPVVKDASLVFLGTTSLYSHGSSQYNRLKLPAGIISANQAEIKFVPMGKTSAFGTVQFPDDTVECLENMALKSRGFREVNSAFGEGPSPKLRKLRTGLQTLGFDPAALLRHHQSRLIFGVPMFKDAIQMLLTGKADIPDYIQDPDTFRSATQRIAEFWCDRWLCSRLNHAPLLDSLSKEPAWKLSLHIPTANREDVENATPYNEPPPQNSIPFVEQDAALKLWRSLAMAGHQTCSDGLSPLELDRLHIPSGLEEYLLTHVRQGYSVVLTGNAGDGKTHLLKKLQNSLETSNAVVDWDATAVMRRGSTAPVLDRWKAAISAGRPYCVAANEYPLHKLLKEGKGQLPEALYAELERQCRQRVAYGAIDESERPLEKLLVIDLSLRNPLSKSFVLSALKKMLTDAPVKAYRVADQDPTFSWNYDKLSTPFIAERLANLFVRLVEHGHRSTIRELWIALAKMLFGKHEPNNETVQGAARFWYSERLLNGSQDELRFKLVELLQKIGDPGITSHPKYDWQIEDASPGADTQWIEGVPPPLELRHRDPRVEIERFRAVKRRFYFEHKSGGKVFDLTESGETGFREILSQAKTPDDVLKGSILKAINFAYCPRAFSGCDRELYLWIGHRFHEQPTRCYIANRSLALSAFSIQLPRLPLRLEGAFDYQPDHFLLEFQKDEQKFRLKVDASLYATLVKLKSGFPRHLAPETDLNKLDDFLARLQTASVDQGRQFVIFSGESRLASRITLSDDFNQYTAVETL